MGSRILAVITHYRYERWLGACIESILGQSLKPLAIVVLDDASPTPPIQIVRRYPNVTLLAARRNGGPYALLQGLFDIADYEGFMLQDADDWSAPDRLEVLLREAEVTGADMVSRQIASIYDGVPEETERIYPECVKTAVLNDPTFHPLLLPTTVLSRDLMDRVGGLSTGLRFGADSKFIRRAVFAGTVRNVRNASYFRRVHLNAMTRAPATGYGSPARRALQPVLQAQARDNVAKYLSGAMPDLRSNT